MKCVRVCNAEESENVCLVSSRLIVCIVIVLYLVDRYFVDYIFALHSQYNNNGAQKRFSI